MFTIHTNKKEIYTNGGNLLSILRENGVFPDSPCGGRGTCGKCAVYIDGRRVLACKTEVNRDMTVTLPRSDSGFIEKCGRQRSHITCTDNGYGIAIDIGTTTIAAYLVNLSDGSVIRTETRLNPQRSYGADVMSRIYYCIKNGTDPLCSIIRKEIDEISDLLSDGYEIKRTVIAANTVMSHIFANADLSGLAQIPFKPEFLNTYAIDDTTLMPCISAYIGGDITSSCLACDMDSETRTVMLIDLGTNGEIVLLHNGVYYCTSTAAGPALEGAGISCGTGSIDGAVCGFEFVRNIPSVKTINEKSAVGICGSGLVDIISSLLKNEVIDEFGTFKAKHLMPRGLSAYISEKGFRITENIYVTQNDIREFQTAKSAICSGIAMLMHNAGVTADEICEVYLCGGLGSNISAESACHTGLLPHEFIDKITVCGNTSGSGAISAVCDMSVIQAADSIRSDAEVIELGGSEQFERLFIQNLNFDK